MSWVVLVYRIRIHFNSERIMHSRLPSLSFLFQDTMQLCIFQTRQHLSNPLLAWKPILLLHNPIDQL
jgi:hypothetical protein